MGTIIYDKKLVSEVGNTYANPNGTLTLYTIYDCPDDHPTKVVIRAHDIINGEPVPRNIGLIFGGLIAAWEWCIRCGLTNIGKDPEVDVPCIQSTWT